jgi:phosphonate C-P lyase system protein PhnG
MTDDLDIAVCHCDLAPLQALVERFETSHTIQVVRRPSVGLTMIRAEDSLENQEFYLGEALTTECEVAVDGVSGIGICLGEEVSRTYCMAVLDALRERESASLSHFVAEQIAILQQKDRLEFAHTMRTKVDFKLLEQE